MKLIFITLFLLFISFSNSYADSDYINDYTIIDCINWDNDTWVAFDNTMPYATLKTWIESTISYINSNINKVWNEQTASWLLLKIKVKCSFDDIFNQTINLNYNGVDYNNELLIEWIDEGSLVFKEVDLKLWYKSWNIIIKNAQFRNENKPYFYDTINKPAHIHYWKKTHPFSYWVKILDSYISLSNLNQLWDNMYYNSYKYNYYNRLRIDHLYNYFNKQYIENSILDIKIDSDFNFKMPTYIKNSKISFLNNTWSLVYNINFLEEGNNFKNSDLISNEIDLWWNNFKTENTDKITFINNKFINVNNFDFSWKAIFINNYIENNKSIDISNSPNLFNNILKSWFTDTYDISNNRRNFSEDNIWSGWLWWIYKRARSLSFFNISLNSSDLYKEVTWKELPNWLWDIYLIFNY